MENEQIPCAEHTWVTADNSLALMCVYCKYLRGAFDEKISAPKQGIGDIVLSEE